MADGRRDALADVDKTVRTLIEGKGRERKKPRYKSEEDRVKGTWDLRAETLARVRAAAAELGVAQYSLVEKLILDGLDRWEAGQLELNVVAVVTTWGIE